MPRKHKKPSVSRRRSTAAKRVGKLDSKIKKKTSKIDPLGAVGGTAAWKKAMSGKGSSILAGQRRKSKAKKK